MPELKRLLNGFVQSGSDYLSFAAATKDFAKEVILKNTDLSEKGDGVYQPVGFDPETKKLRITAVNGISGTLTLKGIEDDGDLKAVMDEIITSGTPILRIDGETYFLAEDSLFTLKTKVGLEQDAIEDENCYLERNAFIQKRLMTSKKALKFVVREEGDLKKAFAFHTQQYLPMGDEYILETLEAVQTSIGPMEVGRWEISQNLTEIFVTFPEKAKEIADTYHLTDYIPGLKFDNSQTGYHCFSAQMVWMRPDGRWIGAKEVAANHRGAKVRLEPFFTKIKDEVFKDYTRLPEVLCNLMDVVVAKAGDRVAASKYIVKLLNAVKAKKVIGVGHFGELREAILAELDFSEDVTAYDIVTRIFDAPERIGGLVESQVVPFANMCGEVPYKAEKIGGSKVVEESLYLTA